MHNFLIYFQTSIEKSVKQIVDEFKRHTYQGVISSSCELIIAYVTLNNTPITGWVNIYIC